MRVAAHGDEGASHAVTYYAVVETSGAEVGLGIAEAGHRPHPSIARAHGAYRPRHRRRSQIFQQGELGTAGRPAEAAAFVGTPDHDPASARGGVIDVTAPLPPHMLQSWNLLGLEADRFDPIENAPEE